MTNEEKKFLDQEGVKTLWLEFLAKLKTLNSRVEELESVEIEEIYGGSATDVIKEAE